MISDEAGTSWVSSRKNRTLLRPGKRNRAMAYAPSRATWSRSGTANPVQPSETPGCRRSTLGCRGNRRGIHHFEHVGPSSAQEPPHQDSRQHNERNVQYGRVIEAGTRCEHRHRPLGWNNTERREKQLDHIARHRHRHVERGEDIHSHPATVVLAVDIQNRQDDQVGENEADHTAETDAATPEYGCQRNIPHRAHEAERGHQRTYNWTLDGGKRRIIRQKERAPEGIWDPCRERASDEKAADPIRP